MSDTTNIYIKGKIEKFTSPARLELASIGSSDSDCTGVPIVASSTLAGGVHFSILLLI